MIEKQDTIAGTMRALMATGPSVADYPTYKALNDYVGALHGLPAGKCQALAGEKAWAWHPDTVTGRWRKSTDDEFASKKEAAARKNNGARKAKVLSDADRAALDAQVAALQAVAVNNPALAPLLEELKARQAADDLARKGSLKDRLQAAVDKLGLAVAVGILESRVAETGAEDATEDATEDAEDAEDATEDVTD